MFHRPAARKRIGSSLFCVLRVWSISSALLRNPPTTITSRRFLRSWTRCGSQERKSNQSRDAEDAEKKEKKRTKNSEIRKGRSDWVGTPFCIGSYGSRRLVPAVATLRAEEERQNLGAFLAYRLELAGVDSKRLKNRCCDLGGGHRSLDHAGMQIGI